MASDDVDWCKEKFGNLADLVFTMDSKSRFATEWQPTFDLAVLSLCDHSILRFVNTVKSVYGGHPWDPEKVAIVQRLRQRWSLFTVYY